MTKINFTDDQARELSKKKINELIELLAPMDQLKYSNFMLSMGIQEEYRALLSSEDVDESESAYDKELTRLDKRNKALKQMIEQFNQMEELYNALNKDEQEAFKESGVGIKLLQQKKGRLLNQRVKKERDRIERLAQLEAEKEISNTKDDDHDEDI